MYMPEIHVWPICRGGGEDVGGGGTKGVMVKIGHPKPFD
jgi:hypothetical protein